MRREKIHTGCRDTPAPPADGDVRLVPFAETIAPTSQCDDVHFGGVELFLDGRWGRICDFAEPDEITLDAQVVCRQLNFPYGTAMDDDSFVAQEEFSGGDYDDPEPATVSWASDVRHGKCAILATLEHARLTSVCAHE